jgi:hypothetical protein
MRAVIGCLVAVLVIGAGCAAGDGDGVVTGSVSGTVTDSTGKPISGAIVVVGESSATGFTDSDGNFTIQDVAGTDLPVQVIVPGYRCITGVTCSAGQSGIALEVYEDPEPENAPLVTINNLVTTASGVTVNVTVTSLSAITDVRAEILGTGEGAILSMSANNTYSGLIPTSNLWNALVMVFAIDANGRHGEDMREVGAPPAGSFTRDQENWVGSIFGIHRGGFNHGRYPFNISLEISPDGSATATCVSLRLKRLIKGLSPVVTTALTGTAKVTGMIYRVKLESQDGVIQLRLSGRVVQDAGVYTGFIHGKVRDLPYHGHFLLINTFVLPNPWSVGALAERPWGLSLFYRHQSGLTPPSYQYNLLMDIDGAGNVLEGTPCTLGAKTLSGASLNFISVQGKNLGVFAGDPGLILYEAPQDPVYYSIWGMMGVTTRRVGGVWKSYDSSTGTVYGYGLIWGTKYSRWDPKHFDAQWQGLFFVTAGPDSGQILNAQVTLNSKGEVTGVGSIVAMPGGTLAGGNIALGGGTLSFSDTSVGAFTGSFTGTQQENPVTINMSNATLPETASMGVYHGRMVGLFSISTNGDVGYYFLFRTSKN